jgi:hypothetical protein
MKSKKLYLLVILMVFVGMNIYAQTQNGKSKTETIKVAGNCGMCEERIEKAAGIDGVESASWDSKTRLLALIFDPSKTNADAVAKKVAAVGHDAGKYKADEKVYNSLPGCCKYDRGTAGTADHSGHKH